MDTSNMIFVFGSNLSGIHGAGAAAYAHEKRGAEWHNPEGPMGTCYAIPTKKKNVRTSIEIDDLPEYVDRFIEYAKQHPELQFQVTRIGCGLAGGLDQDIAPLFRNAPDNCFFDLAWKRYSPLDRMAEPAWVFWGTFG